MFSSLRSLCRGSLLLFLVVWASALAAPPRRYLLKTDCMRPEKGHCFIASQDLGEDGDKGTGNQSRLVLYEDGKELGPARSLHQAIRDQGGGRYSHWVRSSLYFSTSDNSDPRSNGRRYEVSSTNPDSTLGGPRPLPCRERRRIEEIASSLHRYEVEMGGTLDMENTRILTTGNCRVAFQSNLSLTIENCGSVPVVNPRLVINGRGDWYSFDSLLGEFTRGARNDQEKAYLIWQNMRENLYHQMPLFANDEPHDPVRLFNIFGFNLCDDAGSAGCSLFHHAGLVGSKNRALRGHVQCEAFVDGALQFFDVDMDCFYLDRENERPVGGDVLARDHDLASREVNYGQEVSSFANSEATAALFGPDDTLFDARLRGHEIAYTLRPGEKVVFRWDNVGKYCAQSEHWARLPKYFGNSKFIYRVPAAACREVAAGKPLLAVRSPYTIVGGKFRCRLPALGKAGKLRLMLSTDGKHWREVGKASALAAESQTLVFSLDKALAVHDAPAKYEYWLRFEALDDRLPAIGKIGGLVVETDIMAAPVSLPRLCRGRNQIVYTDASAKSRKVRITHEWRETNAVQPPPAPGGIDYPPPGSEIRDSVVNFRWPVVAGAVRYHLQVSRRADFRYPYRPNLDVVIPKNSWCVPYTGIFSPETTYHVRLRCRNRFGAWSPWSRGWTFCWRGPRVPVDVEAKIEGASAVLRWRANPRGERPVAYEIYGSNEKGFSISKDEYSVKGRGTVPGNFLGKTTATSMRIVSAELSAPNSNKTFYRVVAIDAAGTSSGCSDYAELPHPFIYSKPELQARVGQAYVYEIKSLRSLGDYQAKRPQDREKKSYVYKFWDVEENEFQLLEGPDWLGIDGKGGTLSGVPKEGDLGVQNIRIQVRNQFEGKAEQSFKLIVKR